MNLDSFVRKVAQAALPSGGGLGFSLTKEVNLPTGIAGTTSGSDSIPHEIVEYAIAFARAYQSQSDTVRQTAEDLHGALLVAMTLKLIPDAKVYELIDDLNALMEGK